MRRSRHTQQATPPPPPQPPQKEEWLYHQPPPTTSGISWSTDFSYVNIGTIIVEQRLKNLEKQGKEF